MEAPAPPHFFSHAPPKHSRSLDRRLPKEMFKKIDPKGRAAKRHQSRARSPPIRINVLFKSDPALTLRTGLDCFNSFVLQENGDLQRGRVPPVFPAAAVTATTPPSSDISVGNFTPLEQVEFEQHLREKWEESEELFWEEVRCSPISPPGLWDNFSEFPAKGDPFWETKRPPPYGKPSPGRRPTGRAFFQSNDPVAHHCHALCYCPACSPRGGRRRLEKLAW